ncbi:MAG: hypothetical protein K6E36_06425 [Oscillospiraceae bacterium]|nr:hypothetical protein [Oscillospiraceae bacterium]
MLIEAILTAVIVLLILILTGIPVQAIITWAVLILCVVLLLTVASFVLFFLVTVCSLPFYKRVQAQFVRFDDSGRWERAVYLAEGREYICRFPAETVARRRIYREGEAEQHCSILVSASKKNKAYDRHSLFIIGMGTAFSVILITACCLAIPYLMRLF